MKTTIDLDEEKLLRVMKLTGLKTRKEAINFALTETERAAKLKKLFSKPIPSKEWVDAIDPNYDLMALREMDKPKYGHSR